MNQINLFPDLSKIPLHAGCTPLADMSTCQHDGHMQPNKELTAIICVGCGAEMCAIDNATARAFRWFFLDRADLLEKLNALEYAAIQRSEARA